MAARLDVNHFSDWTQEEFEALMLPNKGKPRPSLGNMAFDNRRVKLHRPTVAKHLLPSYVDWRGTPADSPVKDQAACGSCWVHYPAPFLMQLSILVVRAVCWRQDKGAHSCWAHFTIASLLVLGSLRQLSDCKAFCAVSVELLAQYCRMQCSPAHSKPSVAAATRNRAQI